MFKTLKTLLAGILVVVTIVAIGGGAYTVSAAQPQTVIANGNDTFVLDVSSSALSADETADLLYMYEEEKLARDVYDVLGATWGVRTFSNIASSEQMHMDALKVLLVRYGLTEPVHAPGQFANPELQALYTQLVAQGNLSISKALKVGAAIEEIDIRDLQTRKLQTDKVDIQQVYGNLMNGSYNHLRAFTSNLFTQTGEAYQPQYLTAEQYQTIVSSVNNSGNQGGRGNDSRYGNGRNR
jgi:hypothetical protein